MLSEDETLEPELREDEGLEEEARAEDLSLTVDDRSVRVDGLESVVVEEERPVEPLAEPKRELMIFCSLM